MGRFRDRMQNFMSGRYGMDEFGKFLNTLTLILIAVSIVLELIASAISASAAGAATVLNIISWVLWAVTLALIIYSYIRMLSRNFAKRNRENQWFCNIRYKNPGGANGRGNYYGGGYGGYNSYGGNGYNNNFGGGYTNGSYGNAYTTKTNEQKKAEDRKTHRIFKCPNCGQKIRVPKHRGKICIKCPQCRIEFIKKT